MVAPGMLPSPPRMTMAKAFSDGEVAHARVDDEHRPEQRAGGGGEPGAEREGGRVDAVDLHAHQRRRVAVLEGRAHRLAELGAVDERVGAGDQRQGHDEHEQPVPRHRDGADHQRRGRKRGVDRLGDAGPGQLLGVLQGDPGADHHQHGGVDVGAAQPAQQHELDARAPSSAPSSTASASARKKLAPGQHHPHVHHVGAEGVELAVGEVHHPHDAEDQRQADAEQRVRAAQHERVEAVLEELVHDVPPLPVLTGRGPG